MPNPTTQNSMNMPKGTHAMAWVAVAFITLVFGLVIAYVATVKSDDTRVVTAGGSENIEGLESTGEGLVRAAPDQAEITIGVDSRAATPDAASQQNAQKADAILAAITKAGIPEKDVQTVNVSLNPEYDYGEGAPRVTGYIASNTVRIIAREVAQIGPVVDASIAAGASAVQGIQFSFSDDLLERLQDEAREQAVDEALRKATSLAQLSNIRLGKPISVIESTANPVLPPVYYAVSDIKAGGGAPETPVEGGQLEVRTNVTITYEIE